MRFRSLRAKLTITSVLLVGGLLVTLGFFAQTESERSLRAGVDADLARRAKGMIERHDQMVAYGRFPNSGPPPNSPPPPRDATPSTGPRMFDGEGKPIGSNSAQVPYDPAALKSGLEGIRRYSNVIVDAEPIRLLTQYGKNKGKVDFVVQIPYRTGDLERSLRNQANVLLTLLPIGLILAGLVSAVLVGRAMQPLREMSQHADRIGGNHLSDRLTVTGQDEFAELSQTLNRMLGRIEESFEKQKRFTADASHELKTPLAIIKTNASLIHSERPGDQESVAGIQNAVSRMTRLIQDLLLLARSDEPPAQALPMISVADSLEDAISLVGGPIQFERTEASVRGAAGDIERVFVNVLSNATRFAENEVRVAIASEPNAVTVTVTDDGPGIAPEHLARLFDRFYRVDDHRNSDSGGSGLGLAIARSIVDRHGGTIKVESTVGTGTTVKIKLPVGA